MRLLKSFVRILLIVIIGFLIYSLALKYIYENRILRQIIERLQADSRIAEVIVTDIKPDSKNDKTWTTIKFLEYDVNNKPLPPKYFTFSGNIIQFQSLVIRFEDLYVKRGDSLRGKSAYLFWKVFMLDGRNTQSYDLTKIYEVPRGYKVEGFPKAFEKRLWKKFWEYALNPKKAKDTGIKNAQIEAPGTRFTPGLIYTLKIEHDGGIRIDASPIPDILKGEKITN